jgi:hypothetical protein
MDRPGEAGLNLVAYSVEPSSPAEDALKLLTSWAATAVNTEVARARATD